MLRGKEIQTIAGRIKVRDTQIEKDYVISWLLWGIAENETLRENLIFKGGTVLKKAYFDDYRFSEDLDFTLINPDLSDEVLLNEFNKVIENIYQTTAIQLKLSEIERHQSGSVAFYIYYIGPLGGKIEGKSVKIDITRGEKVLYDTLWKEILNTYSDKPAFSQTLQCYALEEVVVEKMVALMGRTQPRDVYDLWYLIEENHVEIEFIKAEFEIKAKHKGHNPDDFIKVWDRKTKQFGTLWKQYLTHQIADLPDYDGVVRAINRHFRTCFK